MPDFGFPCSIPATASPDASTYLTNTNFLTESIFCPVGCDYSHVSPSMTMPSFSPSHFFVPIFMPRTGQKVCILFVPIYIKGEHLWIRIDDLLSDRFIGDFLSRRFFPSVLTRLRRKLSPDRCSLSPSVVDRWSRKRPNLMLSSGLIRKSQG